MSGPDHRLQEPETAPGVGSTGARTNCAEPIRGNCLHAMNFVNFVSKHPAFLNRSAPAAGSLNPG
jgi:hypothetical protein